MKKLLLTVALTSGICVPCLAQVDLFSHYEPVIIGENGGYGNSSSSSNSSFSDLFGDYNPVGLFGSGISRRQRPQQKTQNFTRLTGYYIAENRFVRVSVQVNAVSEMGREQLYLRGVYNENLGRWRNVNKRASRVSGTSPNYIKANFNWEVFDSVHGTIYLCF